MTYFNATCGAVGKNCLIVEISIVRAENIGFALLGGLQDNQICVITQRRPKLRVQDYEVRHALEKLRVFQQVRFRQAVERLKSGIPKHFGYFGEYLIGKEPVGVRGSAALPKHFVPRLNFGCAPEQVRLYRGQFSTNRPVVRPR